LEDLNDHVKSFTIKRLRDTRWEAKIARVKAVRYRTADVRDTLITVAERQERHDPDIAPEAAGLSQQLNDFIF
jgi:hypothetical protein